MAKKKNQYKKSIIKALYFKESISCAELSEILNLSVPLITKLLSELLQDNLIEEVGFAPSTGGRRPLAYSLKKDIFFIVAVAMDQFVTTVTMMTSQNKSTGVSQTIDLPLVQNRNAIERLIEVIKKCDFNFRSAD